MDSFTARYLTALWAYFHPPMVAVFPGQMFNSATGQIHSQLWNKAFLILEKLTDEKSKWYTQKSLVGCKTTMFFCLIFSLGQHDSEVYLRLRLWWMEMAWLDRSHLKSAKLALCGSLSPRLSPFPCVPVGLSVITVIETGNGAFPRDGQGWQRK